MRPIEHERKSPNAGVQGRPPRLRRKVL